MEAMDRQLALATVARADAASGVLVERLTTFFEGEAKWAQLAAHSLVEMLCGGQTFYWSGDIAVAVAEAASGLRGWSLVASTLPSPSGFFWLERPVDLRGVDQQLRAMSWGPAHDVDLFNVIFWAERTGDRGLFLNHWVGLEAGAAIDPAVIETSARLRWFGAALTFMGQGLVVPREQAPDRGSRRRWARSGIAHEPLLRVVELRRRRPEGTSAHREDPVEWSSRWLVRGHWRQQWCPGSQSHRPVWITPYVKGPDGKPLKTPSATVFAVVR